MRNGIAAAFIAAALVTAPCVFADVSWEPAYSSMSRMPVILTSAHATCAELAEDARKVFESSAAWFNERSQGHRRAGSQTIVFFQYKDGSLNAPYAKDSSKTYYFDPFETLGFLYMLRREHGCDAVLPTGAGAWPWGATVPTTQESSILALGKRSDRYLYLESFQGFVSDIYFCSRELEAAQLGALRKSLAGLYAQHREEASQIFAEFQLQREAYCGEERPVALKGRDTAAPTTSGEFREQPTSDVNFSGQTPAQPPLLLKQPRLTPPPFMMPAVQPKLN